MAPVPPVEKQSETTNQLVSGSSAAVDTPKGDGLTSGRVRRRSTSSRSSRSIISVASRSRSSDRYYRRGRYRRSRLVFT